MRKILSVLLIGLLLILVSESATGQESSWTNMDPATSPSARGGHGMAYDSESDRIVLFGGATSLAGPANAETWTYDYNTNTWTNMSPATSPEPRFAHAMAYDRESDRLILFGGLLRDAPETWAYDYDANTWTNMSPSVQPTGRSLSQMVYDSESDRMILFGGCMGRTIPSPCINAIRDETWTYDFNTNTWTNMSPDTSPSRRVFHGMAYDADSDRVVLFGGGVAPRPSPSLGDTWAYDLNANAWTEMGPSSSPSPRDAHSMTYDPDSDRMFLFGGCCPAGSYNDETWVYDFDNDTWVQTDKGTGPSRRVVAGMAYDAESRRIVLFGGDTATSGFTANDETWAHVLAGPAPPLLLYAVLGAVVTGAAAGTAILLLKRQGRRPRKK